MSSTVLYLGDSHLKSAAAYLAGVMSYFNLEFDYLSSSEKMTDFILEKNYKLIIISDYSAANFTVQQTQVLASKVNDGTGLFMIGGWDSFVGLGGGYQNTIIKDVLPVHMNSTDDRCNNWIPCVVSAAMPHPIIDPLPLTDNLPCVGGFNEWISKSDSTQVLKVIGYTASPQGDGDIVFRQSKTWPLLVVGKYGSGRTACFASDVAPHWVGGLVDWGTERIAACADGSRQVEVGVEYANLFNNIIRWTMGSFY